VATLTPAEIAQWQKVVEPLDKQMIATNGPISQAIYDETKALNKKYADVK
jgi:hypothetical protein